MTDHALVVRRPHETADMLVAADAWVVGRSDILLVGQGELPAKTLVQFEIALANGEVVIKGDGWAMSHEPDDGAGTGGLRVRLRTVDKSCKHLLRRMLELQKQGRAERPKPLAQNPAEPPIAGDVPNGPPASVPEEAAQAADAVSAAAEEAPKGADAVTAIPEEPAQASETVSTPEPVAASETKAPPIVAEVTAAESAVTPPAAETAALPAPADETATRTAADRTEDGATDTALRDDDNTKRDAPGEQLQSAPRLDAAAPVAEEKSGVRPRHVGPVATPEDRNALLDRLRARARAVVKAPVQDVEPDKAAG